MASVPGRSQAAAAASISGQQVLESKLERSEKNTVCNGDETDEDSAEDDASSGLDKNGNLAVPEGPQVLESKLERSEKNTVCNGDETDEDSAEDDASSGLDKNGNLAVPEGPMIFTDGSSVQIDLAGPEGNCLPLDTRAGHVFYRHRSMLLELTGPLSARAVMQAVASKIRHENLRQLLLQGMLMRALAASPIYPWERLLRKKWEWLPPFPMAQARNYLRSKEHLEACRFSHAWFYEKTSPVLDLEPDPMAALTAAQLAQLGKHYDRYFSSACGADLLAVWHVHGNKYEVVWSDMHS